MPLIRKAPSTRRRCAASPATSNSPTGLWAGASCSRTRARAALSAHWRTRTFLLWQVLGLFNKVANKYPQAEVFKSRLAEDFAAFDADASGELDLDEFKALLAEVDSTLRSLPPTAQVCIVPSSAWRPRRGALAVAASPWRPRSSVCERMIVSVCERVSV